MIDIYALETIVKEREEEEKRKEQERNLKLKATLYGICPFCGYTDTLLKNIKMNSSKTEYNCTNCKTEFYEVLGNIRITNLME